VHWAIDLGTTNSAVARWDATDQRAHLLRLEALCRDPDGTDPLAAPGVIPSATEVIEHADLATWLGGLPWLSNLVFWGRQAHIGRQAVEANLAQPRSTFVPSFKPLLQHDAGRPVARLGRRQMSAREVARRWLRELLAEIKRATGTRVRTVTLTAPVDAYEAYRAELRSLFASHGVRIARFVDEPVAAAAGYGLSIAEERTILVVDFGGGTLDLAMVAMDSRSADSGHGEVLAKTGRPIGGDVVDGWLLADVMQRLDHATPTDPFWLRLLRDEARWVKEQIYLKQSEIFQLRPPDRSALRDPRLGAPAEIAVDQDRLRALLTERGLYALLGQCTDEVLDASGRAPDDVLLVGGSTLLPGVFNHFESRFGRDRVRAWKPFEAAAHGACTLAARGFAPADHIVHDYAIVTWDHETNERQSTVVVPAGTPFPTEPDFWHQLLVPTCALGEPERLFKLVICEVGRAHDGEHSFGWDVDGRLKRLSGDPERSLVVPLNEKNPTLGTLDPPHPPGDRAPRLDVRLGIDDDRWLVATVLDLKTDQTLLNKRPVVRLL